MINNPQLSLGSVEISVETPFASVTVFADAEPGPDAISVAPAMSGTASLFDAAQDAAPQTPAPDTSTFAGSGSPQGGLARPGGPPPPSSGVSANAQLGASFAARSLEATIATFASHNAGSPAATILSNGALARVLVAAALGQSGAAAQPHGMALLTQAGALLRAADAAPTAAATAALMDDLATLVSKDARELAGATSALPAQTAQATTGIILPQWDPSARLGRADRKKTDSTTPARIRPSEDDRPIAMPDRDVRGRLYNDRERRRLAQLASDPRRGYAPEGRVALAAELEHGIRLERSYDTEFDFADSSGGRWNVAEPSSISGLETTLARSRAGTHVILSAAAFDVGDRKALGALVERSNARAGGPRILVVDGGER